MNEYKIPTTVESIQHCIIEQIGTENKILCYRRKYGNHNWVMWKTDSTEEVPAISEDEEYRILSFSPSNITGYTFLVITDPLSEKIIFADNIKDSAKRVMLEYYTNSGIIFSLQKDEYYDTNPWFECGSEPLWNWEEYEYGIYRNY